MRVLITGGHGFIGTVLTRELLARGSLGGRPVGTLLLADRVAAPMAGHDRTLPGDPDPDPDADADADADAAMVRTVSGELQDTLPELFAEPVDVVFHLASAVSAECERDFDLGLRANLELTRAVLEAARRQACAGEPAARVVFASSVAVYGSDAALPCPDVVSEQTVPMPQSSYGAQKLASETLLADYTRKGFLDGRTVRLMTVTVRPGVPNAAASAFVSGIIREPLAGLPAALPVPLDLQLAIASPRATAQGLLTVAEAPRGVGGGHLSGRLPVNLPALTVSVGQMVGALRAVAGDAVADLIHSAPDPAVEAIVRSWPARFSWERAAALGLRADPDVESIIRQYQRDHPEAIAAR
ncbi:MAG: NAD-dependent epimerase/dehydratase family protein [Austwickia sp.]|nr:NAD-dependent epimerase/dehydratase family protein [Austwickia sp.]MBK8437202.1 NAD-dependent epimerase/dehydratase family protein [Austwickia sp.]